MSLSVYITPDSSSDMYAVYISHGINETMVEPPTESNFDLLFVIPNRTILTSFSDLNPDDLNELEHTIFMPPNLHRGNGTYVIGVKLISMSCLF